MSLQGIHYPVLIQEPYYRFSHGEAMRLCIHMVPSHQQAPPPPGAPGPAAAGVSLCMHGLTTVTML